MVLLSAASSKVCECFVSSAFGPSAPVVELSRKIRALPRTISPVRLIKIGDIRVAQGDRAGALQAFKQSRSIFGKLVKRDASNAGWQHDLSISLMKIGDIRASLEGDRAQEADRCLPLNRLGPGPRHG